MSYYKAKNHPIQTPSHQSLEAPLSLMDKLSQIKGIGADIAKKLIYYFGDETENILDHNYEKIESIRGFGAYRTRRIKESWDQFKHVMHIYNIIDHPQCSLRHIQTLYKIYGESCFERLSNNPYILVKYIPNIHIKSLDIIAKKFLDNPSPRLRMEAALYACLQQAADIGHSGLPIDACHKNLKNLISPFEETEECIFQEIVSSQFIESHGLISFKEIYEKENQISQKLSILSEKNIHSKIEKIKKNLEDKLGTSKIILSEEQIEAIHDILTHKISIVTGGPGVGKTTIINSLCQLLSQENMNFVLCAPTGRAAKRLQEVTGQEAKTIHRLLEINPKTNKFRYHDQIKLPFDLIVIDEISMVDIHLFHSLMVAVHNNTHIICVGDINQLPSIGPGQILTDLVNSQKIHTITLTKIFRQAHMSQIAVNAHRLLQKKNFEKNHEDSLSDFYFIQTSDNNQILKKIHILLEDRIPNQFHLNPIRDIQILAPIHDGQLGIKALNVDCQERLNLHKSTGRTLKGFFVGDKVIQTKNNYDKDIFNGDIGFVQSIDIAHKRLVVDFYGKIVFYSWTEINQLQHAYALTIHKSQGSEYPAIIIPIIKEHQFFWTLPLLYTAITRAKKLAILIGQKDVVSHIIKDNKNSIARYTHLENELKKIFQ